MAPLTVDILAFQNVQLLDLAAPLQVFATVNELCAGQGRPAPYRFASASAFAGERCHADDIVR